ncbi:MAG: nickel/cobalt efflux protein RcnA [Azoarcus sp.]|nr:nickel/cobalt efflux protein RcnA [Azoarcus sp.]
MSEFPTLLQQGNAWLFIPVAMLLGALHGLEPGHSKTMMAAFIVAIRGTLAQAVLLGLTATISHTAVVWAIAMAGLYFGRGWNAETTEPYFMIASGILVVGIALWMLLRTRYFQQSTHEHEHGEAVPPRLPLRGENHHHDEDHGEATERGQEDPHARAHADDIQRRFADRNVTNGQIALFGLTGGLLPCPASITVLLLCLQLKRFALGATLVLSFSVGLALTLVASGALAALGVRHASKHWNGFGNFARKAPYFSGALIVLLGLYMSYQGLRALF